MTDKESEKTAEVTEGVEGFRDYLKDTYTERELKLILNCLHYADDDPAGLPGHNLLLIVSKLALDAGIDEQAILHALGKVTTEEIVEAWWKQGYAKPGDLLSNDVEYPLPDVEWEG